MAPREKSASLFRTRTIVLAVVAAVVTAVAFSVLTVFAPDLRQNANGGAHALSRSSVGYAGLVRLLQADGEHVLVNRNPGLASGDSTGLLILTPEGRIDQAKIEPLTGRGYRVLIIPSKWQAAQDMQHPGWVSIYGLQPMVLPPSTPPDADPSDEDKPKDGKAHDDKKAAGAQLVYEMGDIAPVLTPGDARSRYRPEARYVFGPVRNLRHAAVTPDLTVELRDAQGRAVLVSDRRKGVYYLTDPDLVNNQSLRSGVSAAAAVAMIRDLRDADGPIIFDATLNGLSRERSIFKMALEPPFLAATLCLFGAALLLGWRNIARFGPTLQPVRAVAPGKRMLVENAAGLIRLNGRIPRMAGRYAALVRSMVARSIGAPRDLTGSDLDAYLDRLADPTHKTRPFSNLMDAAQTIHDEAGLLRSAREFFRFRTEVMRERR